MVWVGTRKGLFRVSRAGNGWKVEDRGFLGVPVTMLHVEAKSGRMTAAARHGHFGPKLHRSLDEGATWTEISAPKFPAKTEDPKDKNSWSMDTVWALEGQGDRLWCGSIPGGLFRSDDAGDSWTLISSLWNRDERKAWMGGGADQPGIHSIWMVPGQPTKVRVGVSIGGVWMSDDDGETWRSSAKGMRAAYMPPAQQYEENAQDPHRIVQCPAAPNVLWCQHHNGVFKSEDAGATWEEIEDVPPSTFGFAVAVHPTDPNVAWLVPAESDQRRIPVDGKVVVAKTTNGRNFTAKREGLPQEQAYDLTFRHALDVDETGEFLMFGTTTGSLFASEDGGESWSRVTAHLPPVYCVKM